VRWPLNISVSADGERWEMRVTLEDAVRSSTATPTPAVIQTRDGLVHVTYTWNRRKLSTS